MTVAGFFTDEQLRAITADDELRRRQGRLQALTWLATTLDGLRAGHSDWIDSFGSGSVNVPGWPNPGLQWPANTSLQIAALRAEITRLAFDSILTDQAITAILAVLGDLIGAARASLPQPPT